ncbi:hypothetical protein GCM10027568_04190 [Humibacter soli]
MNRTLRRPLWRWEPGPYLLVLILIVITSAIRPELFPVAYWIFFSITVVAIAGLVVVIVVSFARRSRNPDSAGILRSLEGIELVSVPKTDDPPTPVLIMKRHQQAIDAALSWKGTVTHAVLIPDATRWLGRRIRIAVHLVAEDRPYHVGFLPDLSTERYNEALKVESGSGRYALVTARVMGEPGRRKVDLSLGGLAAWMAEQSA